MSGALVFAVAEAKRRAEAAPSQAARLHYEGQELLVERIVGTDRWQVAPADLFATDDTPLIAQVRVLLTRV